MTVQEHMLLSFQRLKDEIYSSNDVWQPQEYSWPADWEGRCLLALACLNVVSDEKNPYADTIVEELKQHVNEEGYMGDVLRENEIDEQQLSGHGWLLRGLMTYYKQNQDIQSLTHASNIVHRLFLPITDYVNTYPLEREEEKDGGVSGHNNTIINGWRVSTDIGCVFISLDGLTDYYVVKPEAELRVLIDNLINKFCEVDKIAIKAQTHATLTATRAVLRMYECTGEKRYLQIAQKEFENYLSYGMTDTYENFNWFGRPDTWTEPCAVVDSFILALKFGEIFQDDSYKTLARRIWFNGLSYCHRSDGGAGPNTCVTKEQPVLKVSMFEAPFCCTMRYCEGLLYAMKNKKLFVFEESSPIVVENGRRFQDDVLLIQNKETKEVHRIIDVCAEASKKEEEFLVYFDKEERREK